jgi:hypothetical protein
VGIGNVTDCVRIDERIHDRSVLDRERGQLVDQAALLGRKRAPE